MSLNHRLRHIAKGLLEHGVDVRHVTNLTRMPRYLRDLRRYVALGGRPQEYLPILRDYRDSAGVARGHYFHQDLLVAQRIHQRTPHRHVDVGSRIDGFVAHVASFRPIEVIDIRPLAQDINVNIRFTALDLTDARAIAEVVKSDSVSCLHAIEHIGLGRYGDRLDPHGHLKAVEALVDLTLPGGTLYLSFPISSQPRTVFNAHRIFHPEELSAWAPIRTSMTIEEFHYVDDRGDLVLDASPTQVPPLHFGCGIYVLGRRLSSA